MDAINSPWLKGWQLVEKVTIEEAACLLTGQNPRHDELSGEAEGIAVAIEQAISFGQLSPFEAWCFHPELVESFPVDVDSITPDMSVERRTTVCVSDLVEWCEKKGLGHCWQSPNPATKTEVLASLADFPPMLRLAVQAFQAVGADPAEGTGRSVKTVIKKWLELADPSLSAQAREHIATVANPRKNGGAPKSPQGKLSAQGVKVPAKKGG